MAALATVIMIAPAAAQREVPAGRVQAGTLSFDGRATLGDFTGTTSNVSGEVTAGPLAAARGWVEAPVKTLKTGNGKRDTDLNHSVESDKYPTMRYDLDSVAVRAQAADSADVNLEGRLTLHGVTRPVVLPARLRFEAAGIRVTSDFHVNVKDYKVGGLSKLMGVLKMNPDIVVHLNLLFGPGD